MVIQMFVEGSGKGVTGQDMFFDIFIAVMSKRKHHYFPVLSQRD